MSSGNFKVNYAINLFFFYDRDGPVFLADESFFGHVHEEAGFHHARQHLDFHIEHPGLEYLAEIHVEDEIAVVRHDGAGLRDRHAEDGLATEAFEGPHEGDIPEGNYFHGNALFPNLPEHLGLFAEVSNNYQFFGAARHNFFLHVAPTAALDQVQLR